MYQCPKCENQYDEICSLAKHWSRTHHETPKALWLALNGLTQDPTCACGCLGAVRFLDSGRGFREYVHGHASRIKNNFNTEKSMANSIKKRREMLKDGTWKPWFEKETGEHWAKGKTKENCPSIAQQAITRNTPEYRALCSARFRQYRLSGRIPTLYGKETSQWKGGTSSLTGTCYTNTRLYKEWKFPILKAGNFQCSKCQSVKDLHVHHDKIRFAEIIHLMAKEYNWENFVCSPLTEETHALKKIISNAVVDYHVNNNVSGIVLCRACHGELHPSLNFKKTEEPDSTQEAICD